MSYSYCLRPDSVNSKTCGGYSPCNHVCASSDSLNSLVMHSIHLVIMSLWPAVCVQAARIGQVCTVFTVSSCHSVQLCMSGQPVQSNCLVQSIKNVNCPVCVWTPGTAWLCRAFTLSSCHRVLPCVSEQPRCAEYSPCQCVHHVSVSHCVCLSSLNSPGVQSIHHVSVSYFVCLGSLNSPGAMQAACQKLLKAELQGSMLKVQRSKCPSYVGISGIVLQESRHTFILITPDDTVKCKCILIMPHNTLKYTL